LCASAISGDNTPEASAVVQLKFFMRAIDYDAAYASARSPVFGRDLIATSHPLAPQADLAMLTPGGKAVDVAVAAAMALTAAEPTGCGIGGDPFASVWDGSKLSGLNSSGRLPAAWTPDCFAGHDAMPQLGWEAVMFRAPSRPARSWRVASGDCNWPRSQRRRSDARICS
jgi:hypothetical protein